jgi:hypothetical protein
MVNTTMSLNTPWGNHEAAYFCCSRDYGGRHVNVLKEIPADVSTCRYNRKPSKNVLLSRRGESAI